MGSRTELDLSPEKDLKCMSSDGGDIEGHSHSGRKERDSRLAVKTCNCRRLRDSDSKSSRSRSSSGSRPRCGRISKHKNQEKTDMLWARKPMVHGLSDRRLERRSHLGTSPCAPHNALSEKSTNGKSESGSSSSSLEESSMESIVTRDGDSSSCVEGRKGGPNTRRKAKKDWSISSPKGIHGSVAKLVADEGKIWWKQSMRQCGVPVRIQGTAKNSVAQTTWRSYCFGFKHFSRAWRRLTLRQFPKKFENWIKNCVDCFTDLRDRGFSYACLAATRSAISLISKVVYGKEKGGNSLFHVLFRTFSRSQVHRRPCMEMWKPDLAFPHYSQDFPNEKLSFLELTIKSILLIMIFTACRFRELAQLSMTSSIVDSSAVHLQTKLKTTNSSSFISVPFLD
ncbi:uncharacterized protein MONOS_6870 [Monocercomonoides exilis]|uniref:uncharacterized protein n=1 Tax=Monocercomonoides exilis TaxID=2049356 RepID=UPI00355A0512|nr:hypothetical protein MONOS_6870 [Monocercomonoides exilis]|eukprot:MONOS_6870.1-p1 / transcript=MONOS_6870.1 / gene=MONOS_6870 / organism=Monocercomonoides_exilis_PA203 / gene_product=unspecified product / transcript_product=unspecified product / location=Mono_scaffold00225:28816-30003(+) / protein_length=396 / sequence_SO=supercontig / SO=protein_coding / is_pseudo=false